MSQRTSKTSALSQLCDVQRNTLSKLLLINRRILRRINEHPALGSRFKEYAKNELVCETMAHIKTLEQSIKLYCYRMGLEHPDIDGCCEMPETENENKV